MAVLHTDYKLLPGNYTDFYITVSSSNTTTQFGPYSLEVVCGPNSSTITESDFKKV
jgi:hypothetical protein